jgi:hypothetical protein
MALTSHQRDQPSLPPTTDWEDESAHLMRVKLIALLLVASTSWAQSAADAQKLRDGRNQGFAIAAHEDLGANATIEAVLLPASISKALFGKAIASPYAVIELTMPQFGPRQSIAGTRQRFIFSTRSRATSDKKKPLNDPENDLTKPDDFGKEEFTTGVRTGCIGSRSPLDRNR